MDQTSDRHVEKKIKPPSQQHLFQNSNLLGFIWDSDNWSCAYDSVLTILFNMWFSDPIVWTRKFSESNRFLKVLGQKFQHIAEKQDLMEQK